MKRPHRSRRLAIGVLIILVLGLVPAAYAKYRLDLRPVAAAAAPVEFTVAAGQNAQTIATGLKTAGLIRNRNAFITYVNLHGLRPQLKTGKYQLAATMPASEIASLIAEGRTLSKRLVIPEGYRISQIRTAATAAGIAPAAFDAALKAPHPHEFLRSKPANVSLEGYLFPDSYEVSSSTTAASLVTAMLDNFGRRIGTQYTKALAAQGLTLHQGLTIASIVEKEVSIPADRPVVAQIFLSRHRLGMPLGADPTVDYAAELMGTTFNLSLNSPYNTRKFAGLPPGPIASPGLSALDAVTKPASTDYLFFISGKDGKTYFAKTFAEHERNIARYLR